MVELRQNKRTETENQEVKHASMNPLVSLKKTRTEEPTHEPHYVLRLMINNAEGIDPPSKYPGVNQRKYKVFWWINPEDEYVTNEAKGFQKFKWDQIFDIPILNNVVTTESKFLCLEVVRLRSYCDPGPSTGVVVVGRAMVPLPKLPAGIDQCRRYGLVRFVEGATTGEGHLTITMMLLPVK